MSDPEEKGADSSGKETPNLDPQAIGSESSHAQTRPDGVDQRSQQHGLDDRQRQQMENQDAANIASQKEGPKAVQVIQSGQKAQEQLGQQHDAGDLDNKARELERRKKVADPQRLADEGLVPGQDRNQPGEGQHLAGKDSPGQKPRAREATKVNDERDESTGHLLESSNPVGILVHIAQQFGITNIQGINNVLLLFTIVLVVASAVTLIANIRFAVFGILIAIYFLPFLAFIGQTDQQKKKSPRQVIFEWTSLVIGTFSIILLFISVFFDRPVPLKRIAFADLNPDIKTTAPAQFDVKVLSKRDWLKQVADPQNQSDMLRGETLGWINFVADFLEQSPPERDVYVIESTKGFDEPYLGFTRKLTLPALPEGASPLGAAFIVYKDYTGDLPACVPLPLEPIQRRERIALQFTVPDARKGGKFLMIVAVPKGTPIDNEAFKIVTQ